jgi:hypothetical protein
MPRLKIKLLKPHYTPVDAQEFEKLFRFALIDHFGTEDHATWVFRTNVTADSGGT